MGIFKHQRLWFLLILCLSLVGVLIVSAQATPPPLTIGQNTTASITDPTTALQYSLTVAAPQSVNIQVLAITPGFAPTFRVIDPSGAVIVDTANPGTQASVQASPNLSSPGMYIVEIHSANNTAGQFLISVQPGAPLAPPTPLQLGQPVLATVNPQTTRAAYSFSGSQTDVLLLDVISTTDTSGPVVTLRDADSGETLSLTSARMAGIRYRVPLGTTNYLLEITSSGASDPESANICLFNESGSVICPGSTANQSGGIITLTPVPTLAFPTIPPTSTSATVAIDPNGPCEVTPSNGVPDNIRSGPATTFPVITQLPLNAVALVIGRLSDNSWLQVNYNSILGWISTSVVMIGGNCSGVPVIALPTSTPTDTPAPTDTPSPTLAESATPTPSPTFHLIVVTAIFVNTATPTPTPHFIIIHPATLVFHFPTATP
ncbi:MAG TPA: SH3 domain-containing protein [Phototrophicaceae bacterium]|nr:SH3 domain-containing protein [Phototrophicaceae bacterium]